MIIIRISVALNFMNRDHALFLNPPKKTKKTIWIIMFSWQVVHFFYMFVIVLTEILLTYFQEKIATEFLDKLVKWCQNIKISNPLDEGCRLGPVVSEGQVTKNEISNTCIV